MMNKQIFILIIFAALISVCASAQIETGQQREKTVLETEFTQHLQNLHSLKNDKKWTFDSSKIYRSIFTSSIYFDSMAQVKDSIFLDIRQLIITHKLKKTNASTVKFTGDYKKIESDYTVLKNGSDFRFWYTSYTGKSNDNGHFSIISFDDGKYLILSHKYFYKNTRKLPAIAIENIFLERMN